MIKLYMGGSPCTHWSIAQTKNRETEPSGLGWELFQNYVIGLKKYKPDYFLYENNKSMAPAIKAQITRELGVEPMLINSSLVSAQNRQRLYWTNIPGITQPEDKGILLKDILESGIAYKEKAYVLRASCGGGSLPHDLIKSKRDYAAEPICIATIESNCRKSPSSVTLNSNGTYDACENDYFDSQSYRVYSPVGKSVTLCGNGGGVGAKTGLYAVPCAARQVGRRIGEDGKRHDNDESIEHFQKIEINDDPNKTNCLTSIQKDNLVVEPLGETIAEEYYKGGFEGNLIGMIENPSECRNGKQPSQQYRVYTCMDKGVCVDTDQRKHYIMPADGKTYPVYEVLNGQITIKDKQYPIKLPDGYYIIRKLTVRECMRLQTVPEWYIFPVSDSQAYKQLGNGWTVDVISHQLSFIPGIQTEEIEVLSMYDGMSCGHIALDKLKANVTRYYTTEIDKYAIQTTKHNYPNTIHLGDAYQVRNEDFILTSQEGKTYNFESYKGQMTIDDFIN